MKKTLVGVALAATAVLGLAAAPANADIRYISSDGSAHNISSNQHLMPTFRAPMVERSLVNSAVIDPGMVQTQVLTQPAVFQPVISTPRVVSAPVVVDDDRSLFRLQLWPLIDFSLF